MSNRFFRNWVNRRRNPFSGQDASLERNETGLVIPSSAPYLVQLVEVPLRETPSSVTVFNVTAGQYMTEVTTPPAQGQFRVDYAPPNGEGTGLLEFNAANAGHVINVSYKGTGSPVVAEFLDAIVSWIENYEAPFVEIGIQASNNTKNSNDASKSTNSTTAVKVKEIKVNGAYPGSVRVFWQMQSPAGVNVWSQLYKNGTPIGTEKNTTSVTPVNFTEDIAGGLEENDLIQIYARSVNQTYYCVVQNMRLQFDWAILEIYGEELVVGLPLTRTDALDVTNQDP